MAVKLWAGLIMLALIAGLWAAIEQNGKLSQANKNLDASYRQKLQDANSAADGWKEAATREKARREALDKVLAERGAEREAAANLATIAGNKYREAITRLSKDEPGNCINHMVDRAIDDRLRAATGMPVDATPAGSNGGAAPITH